MFEIKTEDKSIKSKNDKISISFLQKLRLINNCYPNKRQARFLSKGDKLLRQELDMINIFKEIKAL